MPIQMRWRWAQGTGSLTLSHGKHNLQIRNREGGLSLDKIAFVPTSATGPSGTGTGSGTGTYFVSPDGTYLGGDWQLRSALKISGSFANDPLPITVTQTTKVTALK